MIRGSLSAGASAFFLAAPIFLALAAVRPAVAQVTETSADVNVGSGDDGAPMATADGALAGSFSYTVPSGSNALVVQYGEFAQSNTGADAATTIEWGGTALTPAIVQVSSNPSYVYAEVFYLYNPPAGAGTLSISGEGRTFSLGALTLAGVNTAIAPITAGSDATTGTTSAASLSGLSAGSFAAISEGVRVNSSNSYTLAASNGTATQGWSTFDSGSGDVEYGGGTVSGLSSTTATFTETQTASSGNRNEIAAAAFGPLVVSAVTWSGLGGSGGNATWTSGASDNNWVNSSGGGTANYSNGLAVSLGDTYPTTSGTSPAGNTNITIASAGVGPSSVTFTNNSTTYTLANTNSANGIGGSGTTVTLGGSGTVIFNGANTYTGATTINSGTLRIGNSAALQNSVMALNATGGLRFSSGVGSVRLGGLSGSANLTMTDLGSNPVALTLGNSNTTGSTSASYSGNLTSTAALTKTGTNTQTLTGNNSFSGVTISAGTLSLGPTAAGSLPLGSAPITFSGTSTLRILGQASSGFQSGFGGNDNTFPGNNATYSANGWTVNNNGIASGPFPSTNVLQLTDNAGNEARSAFSNTPISVAYGFNASFVYQATGNAANNGGADGVTFALQEAGPTALGGGGGSLGYAGIANPSAAVELNIYNPNTIGTAINTNGTIGGNTAVSYLSSGDLVQVQVSYNAATSKLTEMISDLTNTANATVTISSNVNLASLLGSDGAYVGFTGGDGGSSSIQQISNYSISYTGIGSIAYYTNNLTLSGGANATIDASLAASLAVVSLGNLQVNSGSGTTLNVTATAGLAGQPYGLSLGNVSLLGSVTFNVANNTVGGGNALGTLTLGALNDNGSPVTITLGGAGAVALDSPATSLVAGTVVNINGGTLNSNAAAALGTAATVTLNGSSSTLAIGASQTVAAVNSVAAGSGQISIGSGTALTVGNSSNLNSNFSGVVGGSGSLFKAGSGTLTLSGQNTFTGGTTVSSGLLIAGSTASLGAGAATLSGGTLRLVPSSGSTVVSGFGGNGTGWTVNSNGITSTAITSNVLTLTDNGGNEARSAFYDTPVSFANGSSGFTASYVYQAAGGKGADGVAFVLQDSTAGTAALGGNGSGLGLGAVNGGTAISPSAEVELNIYTNNTVGGVIDTDGTIGPNTAISYLNSGDRIQVSVSYFPTTTTLQAIVSDLTNPSNPMYTLTNSSVNLASLLGSTTAYMGFTGSTGGVTATQAISSFSYTAPVVGSNSTYANALIVNAGAASTIDVAASSAVPVITAGPLAVASGGSSTLNITDQTGSTNGYANSPYGLTVGGLSLGSSLNLGIGNNGTAAGAGTLTIAGAPTFGANTNMTINSGTVVFSLPSSAAVTIGSGASVTVAAAATLQLAGTVSAFSDPASGNLVNVTNHGSLASGGGLQVTGGGQTVGEISGTASGGGSKPTTYDGDTVVGTSSAAASLTATQILQNSLTINAGSTVTIAPAAGDGDGAVLAASATASSAVADSAVSGETASGESGSDPFAAIQAAIAGGAISGTTGRVLENRIAAIERLAASDPGLDASLMESRVLAVLPSSEALPPSGQSGSVDSASLGRGASLLAFDSSAFGESPAGAARGAFSPSGNVGDSPVAVPEPSSLLLALVSGMSILVAARPRSRRLAPRRSHSA